MEFEKGEDDEDDEDDVAYARLKVEFELTTKMMTNIIVAIIVNNRRLSLTELLFILFSALQI